MADYALPWNNTRASTGGGGDDVGPVYIGTVEGLMHAEIARSYLEDAGLTVFLQGKSAAGAFGLPGGALAAIRIYVPAAQAEEGRMLLQELDWGDEEN
jgi:hypothetical protein